MFWPLADFLGPLGGALNIFLVEDICKTNTLAAKLSNETYVYYYGNMSKPLAKVTQTKTKYDQF